MSLSLRDKFMGGVMRKAALVGAVALLIASPAFAEGNLFYIEGMAGYEFGTDIELAGVDVPTDAGYRIGGAFGSELPGGLTFESELSYAEREVDGAPITVSSFAIMANAYFDWDFNETYGGYVGGGIGTVGVEIDLLGISDSDWTFGYQGIVGGTIQANENVKIFGEYRYQAAPDLDIGTANVTYDSHTLGIGVRFGFY